VGKVRNKCRKESRREDSAREISKMKKELESIYGGKKTEKTFKEAAAADFKSKRGEK